MRVFANILFIFLCMAGSLTAQTTAFTYQGSLKNNGQPANGTFDFQFTLHSAATGTNVVGPTITVSNVEVVNGVFTTTLDWGTSVYPTFAARFLEIAVRSAGGGSYTPMSPREVLKASPYATSSFFSETSNNASSLGGVAANQYVTTTNGGANFIQNTTSQQASSNFSISGNGIVGGNFGIGTNAPTAKFHIADGSAQIQMGAASGCFGVGALSFAGAPTCSNYAIFGDAVNTAVNRPAGGRLFFREGNVDQMEIATGGNVGIGLNGSSPTAKLHVSGNGLFSGNLTVNGTLNANLPVGSPAYIQNQDVVSQAGASFKIGGNGSAAGTLSGNVVRADSFFSLGNDRVLSTSTNDNIFLGVGAGSACAASCRGNSFFGNYAGNSNSFGVENSFFGTFSGRLNNSGANSFFGFSAGAANTLGGDNAFFGGNAGLANTTANQNSFFGRSAGGANTTGSNNSFFGRSAGLSNTTGANNTIIGTLADTLAPDLSYATAIGAGAQVGTNNTVVLGRANGSDSVFIPGKLGIGSQAPVFQLDVGGRIRLKQDTGSTGTANTAGVWLFQNTPNNDRAFFGMQDDSKVGFYGNTGGGWGFAMNTSTGTTIVNALGSAGSTSLCRNASNEISTCSSSARYKNNINTFTPGLDLIKKLRPVSFNWLDGGMLDMGLVAEEVNKAEPLLTTTNAKGEVEGVKYDRVGVVLVNAIKEQQAQIDLLVNQRELQQKEIERQRVEIAELKKRTSEIDQLMALICGKRPRTAICKLRN